MSESIALVITVAMISLAAAYLSYDFSEYRKRRRSEAEAARRELAEITGNTPAASFQTGAAPATALMDSALLPEEAKSHLMNAVWYRCENPQCNYTHFLDVYHIAPQSNGGANALDNLIVLCPSCRAAAGKGEINADEMRFWVKERGERLKFAIDWPYR